jgi:tetratricopeptide (TPR) repeat protein
VGEYEVSTGGDGQPHFEKSLASFDEALKRSPGYWTAAANKGLLLENLGRLEEALEILTAALEMTKGRSSRIQNQLQRVKAKLEKK